MSVTKNVVLKFQRAKSISKIRVLDIPRKNNNFPGGGSPYFGI